MKATILLSFFLFVFSLPAADEKKVKSEKSYAERLKEAYDEKVKAGERNLRQGRQRLKDIEKEKYGVGLEEGKNLTQKSKEWLMKDIENIGDWEYKVVSYGSKDKFSGFGKGPERIGQGALAVLAWVEAAEEEKVFYFKRTKMSYLSKYFPKGTGIPPTKYANHRRFSEQLIGIGLICL